MLIGLKKIWVSTHQKIMVCYIDVSAILKTDLLVQPRFPKTRTHFLCYDIAGTKRALECSLLIIFRKQISYP